ncbi:hypothetical protein EJB05_48482, partial [Eragrostis curvula]
MDKHIWTPDPAVGFTTKSAYNRFFMASVQFEPYRRLWKSWAPLKVKIFLWLAILNRCWTADRLARRGMQHPEHCPLCDQEEENIQHLLTTCVVAREVWFHVLRRVELQSLMPDQDELNFKEWWRRSLRKVPKEKKKGFNTLVMLTSWGIWKQRNSCVFDAATPQPHLIVQHITEEATEWKLAGARRLSEIMP